LTSTHSLSSLLSICGTPPNGAGIYLHILWLESDPRFYLYVGQSQETQQRIQHHNDPRYRERYKSLHYYVWEKLGPNVKSAWVMLSAPGPDVLIDPLSLNLLEMWCSLTLQTLPKDTLAQYLPCETLAPQAGCHLNLASPLSQSVQSKGPEADGLGNLYASDDSLFKEYFKERVRQYRELRNSNDPFLRDYWWDNAKRAVNAANKTVRDRIRSESLEGMELPIAIRVKKSTQTFSVGPCLLSVPIELIRLAPKKILHVQCVLTESPDNDCYAQASRRSDDASRLLVRICGTDVDGKKFDGITYSNGQKCVYKANTLFDILAGRSLTESRNLPRRYMCCRQNSGRLTKYT